MKKILNVFVILITPLFSALLTSASDHVDGPVTKEHRVADISDFYVFQSPGNKNNTTIIMNTYPFVGKSGHFSNKVTYEIHIINLNINKSTGIFDKKEKAKIVCESVTPHSSREDHSLSKITCTDTKGNKSIATLNASPKSNFNNHKNNHFPIFAGRRLDPFFIDTKWATETNNSGKISPSSGGDNDIEDLNVLSIAIDINLKDLFGHTSSKIYGFYVESLTQDSPGSVKRILDRVGRAEITNFAINQKTVPDIRDSYNQTDTLNIPPRKKKEILDRLLNQIKYYDNLDGYTDWSKSEQQHLANIFIDDFLVIDLSKPCSGNGFLEIEKSLIAGRPHETCGGRKLTDDIVDRIYTYYISKDRKEYGDSVNTPSKSFGKSFPYLNTPATGVWAWIKAKFAYKKANF